MPIPKVGDVVTLALPDHPSWDSLRKEPVWLVDYIDTSLFTCYAIRLRSLITDEICDFEESTTGDKTWPLTKGEVIVNPFLTKARNAIQPKENQHDEPASK